MSSCDMKDYKAFFKSKITEEVGWVIVSAKDEFEAERIVESMLNKSYELMFVEEKTKVKDGN